MTSGCHQSEQSVVSEVLTPAFVWNQNEINNTLSLLNNALEASGCKLLFPLKACALIDVLKIIEPRVDGFSTSSVFESKLARFVLGTEKIVHFTSPLITDAAIESLEKSCDSFAYNSIGQYEKCKNRISGVKNGIRINPGLSFVEDERYDPCRKQSKLGVPIKEFVTYFNDIESEDKMISGIHFHSNCESSNVAELSETVEVIIRNTPDLIKRLDWFNLGGGYLINENNTEELKNTLNYLVSRYDIQLLFEPGKCIVGQSCNLVTSVVDIIRRDGKELVILDTSVCHIPEVFEYQYQPEVLEADSNGECEYILCGGTCLAGDMFGSYFFKEPLRIGSRLTFSNTGAYSLVKASMFNGLNMPSIYFLTADGKLVLQHEYNYDDFIKRLGVTDDASI